MLRATLTSPGHTTIMLTRKRLLERLHYNPKTGKWKWRDSGKAAGSTDTGGYIRIKIDGKKYRSARLAHLYQTGRWPPVIVDHHNLDSANDKWKNLRPGNNSQNQANRAVNSNNKLGLKGVNQMKSTPRAKPFMARIMVRGEVRFLGCFRTAKEAHAVYLAAAKSGFGEFARG